LKLVLATHNRDKVKEIKALLKNTSFQVLTLDDFPEILEIEEDGETLEQNAYKKAKVVFDRTGLLTLADDTGLEVNALDGRPGVYSSRFSGSKFLIRKETLNFVVLFQSLGKILRNLQKEFAREKFSGTKEGTGDLDMIQCFMSLIIKKRFQKWIWN